MAIQNKTFLQDIHSKTYNDKNSKPQQKHRLGKILTVGGVGGGLKLILRGHNPRP